MNEFFAALPVRTGSLTGRLAAVRHSVRRYLSHSLLVIAGIAAFPAFAAFPTFTTLTSTSSQVAAGAPVTFRAVVDPSYGSPLAVNFPVPFGSSTGAALYFTYTLAGGVFGATITSAAITDVTTPAAIGTVNVLNGGNAGDTSVLIEVFVAPGGMPVGDIISLAVPAIANTTAGVSPTVLFTFGFAPGTPFSTTGPTSLAPFTSGGTPTGTIDFQSGGVSIPGCSAVAMVASAAQCTTTFATAGIRTITAVYPGAGNNFTSTGSLLSGLYISLAITPATVPNGQVNKAYSAVTIASVGGMAPYAFNIIAGNLPPGMTLSLGGVLSGTPTVTGTYNFTVVGFDNTGNTGQGAYALTVTNAPQTITFTLPANSTVGSAFTLNGVATSGLAVIYSVTTPAVCSVAGNVLNLNAGGNCTVVANQPGDTNNAAAAPVSRTVAVAAGGTILLRSTDAQLLVGRFSSNQMAFIPITDPGANFRLLAVADIDGNGINDLVYQNITQGEFGDARVWADFQSGNDRLLRNVKLAWDVQAVGDLDGDGFGDLVFRYNVADSPDTGVSYIWFTNGSTVTQVRKRGGAPLSWTLLGAADLNGDRAADMVYVSPANQIRILMATRSRTCANYTAGTVLAGYTALKLADFTGNHRGDILIRNATSGDVRLITLDGRFLNLPTFSGNADDPNAACTTTNQSLTALTYPAIPSDPTWQYYASVDLNGDGINDVIWLKADGTLAVWLMNPFNAAPTVVNNAGTAPVGFSVFKP